ncbi:tyrosine-type recombinase/integrase [Streptomyces sp. NPDC020800]|uniref:tyrosine-type recombinase/integrase n=1 Tax=Streptomyces sp. NPDC020800 TaxID=3365092 RepID=UPI0037B2435E
MAGLIAWRPGSRPRLCHRLLAHPAGKGTWCSLSERDCIVLLDGVHQLVKAPIVLVWDRLKAFRALQAEERLALGEAYVASGYVLMHEAGDAFTINQLRRRACRLMKLLGLRRVRLYDARSSCFTFLANNGVPDHILARWAGHTNVKTTKRWCVKPDVEDLRGAATTGDGLHGVAAEVQV